MIPPLTLVVLAAGMGSRYGGLKQLDPVGPGGEIVLDYAVYDALQAGFGRLLFVIRRAIEKDFRALVEPRLAGRIAFDYAFQSREDLPAGARRPGERGKPWGTGQAVWACRNQVSGPFGVVNADDVYGRPAYQVLAAALEGLRGSRGRYCLVAYPLATTLSDQGPVSRGICELGPERRLRRIVERKAIERSGGGGRYREGEAWVQLAGDTPTSTNMWGFTPGIFRQLEQGFAAFLQGAGPADEFLLPAAVDALIAAGRASVEVFPTESEWLGVTYPEDKPALARALAAQAAAGRYPVPLWGPP